MHTVDYHIEVKVICSSVMTRKELNLAIYEGTADAVLWQPRLETWINHHQKNNTAPPEYKNLDYYGIYDKLGCSVRYAASRGIERFFDDEVEQFAEDPDQKHHVEVVRLPEGELRTIYQNVWEGTELKNRRIVKFAVETVENLKVLTALVKRQRFRADLDRFADGAAEVGHRAEPTQFASSDGFTDLIKFWSGLLSAYYLKTDHPAEMDTYMEATWDRDEREMEELFKLPCRLFNLGDHTTNEFTPPPTLEKYCLPRWQRISKKIGDHNGFVHSHWDGNSRHILKYLKPSGLHAVEALTPEPMGDMTLEMIKEAVGDELVVLDLIPAIFFLPEYPKDKLLEFTDRVIDMFAPKLILGVSDEISQRGEIDRIEAISELVDKRCGLAE